MTDIFAQEGITFQSSGMASTNPTAQPAAIAAPKVNLPPQDAAPVLSDAPHGNKNMSPDDKNQAIMDLYGDGEAAGEPSPAAPMAAPPSVQQPTGRDIFADMGIEPPTVTQANANAFMDGTPLNTKPQEEAPVDSRQPQTSDFAPISKSAMSQVDFGDKGVQQQAVQSYAASDDAMIMKLASMRFTPSQIEQWKKPGNKIGIIEAIQKLHANQVLPGGGIAQMYNSLDIANIADKKAKGEPLTPDDQNKLNAFLDEQIEQRVRGFSWGGNIAYVGSQIPAFGVEFALSDGVGKMAQTAAKKAAEEALMHSALTSSISAASRVATTMAFMPGQYFPKYGERRVNDIMAVTDKGDLIIQKGNESPATSALLAFAHTGAEVAAQIAAPGIGKYVINPVKKLVSTPLVAAVNKLPFDLKDQLYQAYKLIQPAAKVSKVFTAAGWTGMLEQLGANRVSEIVHASLDFSSDDKMTMDQYLDRLTPSKDQLLVEAGLVGIAGGIHASASVAYNLIKSKGIPAATAQETVDNMSATERDNFVNENLPMPESSYPENAADDHTPPTSGMVRLYRAESSIRGTAPEWIKQAQDENGHTAATGRWFTMDTDALEWYRQDVGESAKISYIDVPQEKLADYLVANQPDVARFSRDPKNEFFVPAELAALRQELPPAANKIFLDEVAPGTSSSILYDGMAVKTQTESAQAKEPPPIQNEESVFNWLHRAFFNRGAAAEEPFNRAVKSGFIPKLMDNTPLLMSLNHQIPELARSHMMVNTFKWDENGHIVNTGKSLKSILDDFDNFFLAQEPNRETRRNDFEDYLIARHYLSLKETAPHILVTPEQLEKSKADLDKIIAKYGDNAKMFNTLANEFVEYRNRTRDLLVGTLLTKEQRANEKKLYPYSVPLKREMDPKEYEAAISAGDYAGLNPGNLTKRLKGSALPVKNILHSTMRETARIIDFVMHMRVNQSIDNLKEFAPDLIKEESIPIVKKGTAEFTISYDPKLREKLEKAMDFLGGSVVRGEAGKIGLDRRALGSYSPQENLVRMRIGSTEGTLAHEVGHALDHKLDLKKRLLQDPEIKKELQQLAEDRLSGEHELVDTLEGLRFKEERQKAGKKYTDYIKNDDEILANMFDAYVNSPEQLEAVAPKAKAAFEQLIDENKQLAFLRDIKPSTSRQTEKIKKDVYGHGDLPPNTIPLWKNGEKTHLRVAKPMFESLSAMRPSQISSAARFFTTTFRILGAAKALTFGATNTLEFIERNPVRDSLEATVQSGVKYNPLYAPKSLHGMLTKSPQYQEFVQAGGKFASFMALDDANIEKTFEDILNPKSTFRKLITNPLEAYEKIPKASETLTRFGVYRAALDKGYSPVEAAQFALDATLNFPRGGFVTKKLNEYAPFLNVGFLATERLVRALKSDPQTVALRGITYLTAPSLLIAGYYLYGADEETRKEWLELPINHIAEGRVYFKYNGEWRYIPTPYAIGYLFSGLPQLALRSVHQGNPDDGRAIWQHLMKGFVGAVSPIQDWSSVIPPTVKVAIEDITNYDFYKDKSIYSKFKEGDNVLQKDKTNSYDTETAKAIGNLFNVSPALIDHTIYGLFGGSGGYALKASDAAINGARRASGEAVPEKPRTGADIPVVAAFTSRAPEGTRSNSYQGWQLHYQDVQAIASHLKNMPASPEKAEYQKENARILAQLPQQKSAAKVIENRLKQIRNITIDPHMSSEQKTEHIGVLEKEITRVARNSNNQYNAALKADK